jgi:hypothetical protein
MIQRPIDNVTGNPLFITFEQKKDIKEALEHECFKHGDKDISYAAWVKRNLNSFTFRKAKAVLNILYSKMGFWDALDYVGGYCGKPDWD